MNYPHCIPTLVFSSDRMSDMFPAHKMQRNLPSGLRVSNSVSVAGYSAERPVGLVSRSRSGYFVIASMLSYFPSFQITIQIHLNLI